MKKLISICLAVCMLLALAVPAFAADYNDTKDHWAKDAIDLWSSYDVLHGYSPEEFAPDRRIIRAEAAQIMANLLRLTEKADISMFTDVDPNAWYADAISMCVAAGILKGISSTEMNPTGAVTREMFFVMFARALGVAPEAELKVASVDAGEISEWAQGYLNALLNHGYVLGVETTEDGATIAPKKEILRAEVVALMSQTISDYIYENGKTVVPSGNGIVLVVAKNVEIKDAPEGTTVVTGYQATGTVINGVEVKADSVIIVGEHIHEWEDGKCVLCGTTMEKAMKFELSVKSGASTVTMTVFNDYAFLINVPAKTVDAASVTATVKMQNVASMDINELREHSITINTGITGHDNISLQNWLSKAWEFGVRDSKNNATINVKIGDKECTYVIYNKAAAGIGEDTVILGIPEDVAAPRAAWLALIENITCKAGLEEDSYFSIANGSYFKNGTELLGFAKDYTGALKLDNFSDLEALKKTIKEAVVLETVEGDKIEALLKAGTELQLGSSKAVLFKDATVSIDTAVPGALTDLRAAANAEGNFELAEALVKLVNGLMGSVQGKTINVAVSFDLTTN